MVRYRPIDTFRGLAILGMVFFTVTLRLSNNLPESLRHNVWGVIHLGDFILPMFLFASGLSLPYFIQKREKEEQGVFLRYVIERFVKLALIGVVLSFFSAYGFLEMDEVMLSALSFIICIALYKLDWKVILAVIFTINLSYIFLMQLDMTDIFIGHYLGGYPAVPFYLPVMLTGLILGKGISSEGFWCEINKIIIVTIFIFFIIFRVFIPLNKMIASPSFIMLSILFSLIIFAVVERVTHHTNSVKELEYLGKKPLRYWVMMYVVFIVPLWFYVEYSGQVLPLNINWPIGIIISLGLMILFWGIFYSIDRLLGERPSQ